jgi:hypothetical protein
MDGAEDYQIENIPGIINSLQIDFGNYVNCLSYYFISEENSFENYKGLRKDALLDFFVYCKYVLPVYQNALRNTGDIFSNFLFIDNSETFLKELVFFQDEIQLNIDGYEILSSYCEITISSIVLLENKIQVILEDLSEKHEDITEENARLMKKSKELSGEKNCKQSTKWYHVIPVIGFFASIIEGFQSKALNEEYLKSLEGLEFKINAITKFFTTLKSLKRKTIQLNSLIYYLIGSKTVQKKLKKLQNLVVYFLNLLKA